jgi:methionine sulfoxide reductase heme-binding subunit
MSIWFTMRGAGLTALVLLTITTCIGVLVSGGGRPDLRYIVQYVHRVTASLGLGVLLLHVVTALMDSYAGVGITGAIVPFTSGYRATWVGLGTIAAYLIVLVAATGFARGRIAASEKGAAVWRTVHGLSYGAWGLALIHGFESGTDSGQTWVRFLYLACLASVPTCLVLRNPSPKVVAR